MGYLPGSLPNSGVNLNKVLTHQNMVSVRLSSVSTWQALVLAMFTLVAGLFFGQPAQAANDVTELLNLNDSDLNGEINRIQVYIDNDAADTWVVNGTPGFTVTQGGEAVTITSVAINGSASADPVIVFVNLNESTTDVDTDGVTTNAMEITYAQAGGGAGCTDCLRDGGAELTAIAAGDATSANTELDTMYPVVASVSPASGASGTNITTDIVITFSEAINTTFVEGGEFSVSPDPGAFGSTFSSGNKVVTLTFPDLSCATTYTVTTDETAINDVSSGNYALVTSGPEDGDWSFTTSCGGGGAYTPPQITSFTYSGPVCTTTGAQGFAVTGTNISAYLVADNSLFVGSEWQTLNIEGTGSFEAVFDESDATAYSMLKSDDGSYGNVYTFPLSSWAEACGVAEEEDDVTDDTEVPSEDGDDDGISPVAGVTPGEVILSSSSTAVYYVTENYGRRVFINEAAYFSWFNSFDVVNYVSPETLSALPLEGTMLPKAETVLVKIQSSPTVYFIEDTDNNLVPELRAIPDETTAAAVFGSTWADYVIDIEPTFFTKFETGTSISLNDQGNLNLENLLRRVDLHE